MDFESNICLKADVVWANLILFVLESRLYTKMYILQALF